MEIEIGEELIIPFKPDHHLNNTGILCKVKQIHSRNVYVIRFNKKENRFNKCLQQVDKSFLEQHKEKLIGRNNF